MIQLLKYSYHCHLRHHFVGENWKPELMIFLLAILEINFFLHKQYELCPMMGSPPFAVGEFYHKAYN